MKPGKRSIRICYMSFALSVLFLTGCLKTSYYNSNSSSSSCITSGNPFNRATYVQTSNPFDRDTYVQTTNPFDKETFKQTTNPFDKATYIQNTNPFDNETYRQGPFFVCPE